MGMAKALSLFICLVLAGWALGSIITTAYPGAYSIFVVFGAMAGVFTHIISAKRGWF